MVDVKYPVPFEEGLFTENFRETKKIVKNISGAFRLSKTNRVNPDQDSSNICRDMQARHAFAKRTGHDAFSHFSGILIDFLVSIFCLSWPQVSDASDAAAKNAAENILRNNFTFY